MRRLALLGPALLAACATAPAAAAGPWRNVRVTPATPPEPISFIGQPGTSESGAAIMRATHAGGAALGAAGRDADDGFQRDRVTVWLDPTARSPRITCG